MYSSIVREFFLWIGCQSEPEGNLYDQGTFCGIWNQGFLKKQFLNNLTGRKSRAYGTI